MLHLVQSSPRDFYARDRNKIINAACGLLGKEYARPLDAIEDLLALMQYTLVHRPVAGKALAITSRPAKTVTVCTRIQQKIPDPSSADGVYAFALARELGHIRLHLSKSEVLLPIHKRQADDYAGTFLVPRSSLMALPAFSEMISAGRAGLDLWRFVVDLAAHFGVTKSCMARQLEELRIVVHNRDSKELQLSA